MSTYMSMETLNWMLFEVFRLGDMLKAPRFQDHDEQSLRLILDSVKKFADAELYPVFRAMDADPARMIDGKVIVHPAVKTMLERASELGLVGSTLDYDDGGMQLPVTLYQALNFIADSSNNNMTGYTGLTSGAAGMLASFGSQELKDQYMAKMLSNEWGGTMALTEPQAGSSLSDVVTDAIPRDDGSYSVHGQKIWISGGDHQFAENFIHFTLVRVPGGGPGTKGISLMLIPKFRPENGQLVPNDVSTVGDFQKMGQRGYTTTHLVFGEKDDCRGWLVGTLHRGLEHMFYMMNGARIHVGRHGAAIATAAYYASRQFALERPQGRRLQAGGVKDTTEGQTLIINHPDVRRMLLLQKAIAEGSLALVLQASVYADLEKTSEGEEAARYHDLLELLTPMAKTYPAEAGRRSVDQGLQVLGGAGFCDEYVLQQYYRDVRIMAIYEGTTGIQSLDLLGRKVFMNKGASLKFLLAEIEATCAAASSNEELKPYVDQLREQLGLNQKVLGYLMPMAAQGEFEKMLSDATLYMEFFSNIVVAWQWLKLGLAASSGSSDFHRAKVHTMKFFFQYELSKNPSLAGIIMQPQRLTIVTPVEVLD
ncbi:MAG: acyl-CoA dehydrogenase [Candidatus Eremiobacteraeota bacterium]|nr:acyl-CoA dehydrogenase [Candidatus Eremiobacteraeota bacterium]